MSNTRVLDPIALLPIPVVAVALLPSRLPAALWLKSCHGTGINLPVVDPAATPDVPMLLDLLEGTVCPAAEVSVAAPADDIDRIANSIRPD